MISLSPSSQKINTLLCYTYIFFKVHLHLGKNRCVTDISYRSLVAWLGRDSGVAGSHVLSWLVLRFWNYAPHSLCHIRSLARTTKVKTSEYLFRSICLLPSSAVRLSSLWSSFKTPHLSNESSDMLRKTLIRNEVVQFCKRAVQPTSLRLVGPACVKACQFHR